MADLRIGTYLAPNVLPVYEAVATTIETRLGLSTELVIEEDYSSWAEDANDLAFICGLAYVAFEEEGIVPADPIAAPVLIGDRYQDRPIYFSDVIVRRDHPARSFMDLRGTRWSYNEPLSQSGYGITRHHLVELEETSGFFGEVIQSGYHEKSIEQVRTGSIDAAAIDSQVLTVAMGEDPSLRDDIRILESLGPSTIQPVTVSRRVDETLRNELADLLGTVHHQHRSALAHGAVARFTAIAPEDYDDVRRMMNACRTAGFMELR